MQYIRRNPHTHNYDIDITVDEWKQILCLPAVQDAPNILDALKIWYKTPDYTSSCKKLAFQYNKTQQYFSVQNRRLGEIAVRYLYRFHLIGSDGKEMYWAVPWIELSSHKGEYTVMLRPELVEAIRQLALFD